MKIRKVVIPAAGLGTRFLPATKAQPKEMLPIVDKPTIQYIMEEAVASGIESVIIITGRSKRAIEDHFDSSIELELELERSGKEQLLEQVRHISDMVNVHYIRQKHPRGLGHAILCAKEFVGNEPFGIMLGDVIMDSKTPALRQLMDAYERENASVIGVQPVAREDISKYGIIQPGAGADGLHELLGMVEKPSQQEAPSNLAILGRYVLTPEIFEILEHTGQGKGGEIQLTDALFTLLGREKMYALELEGKLYDVGDRFGFLHATCEFALGRDDLREQFGAYLKELAQRI